MRVRLALSTDRAAIYRLGVEYADEVRDLMPGVRFEEERANQVFSAYLERSNPTIFVAEASDGDVVGFMLASIQPFPFMSGLWTNIELIYVTPVKRGTRAAAELLSTFDAWSERIGAKMSMGGNANKLHSERTASFFEKFGFQRLGFAMAKFRDR